jgi:hypothetical protein
LSDKDKLVISHYKTVGRAGKTLVKEEVKAGSDTARFLERMEQRRLSTPCHIAIDMRGKVEDTCEAYEFQGLVHYMDEKCIDIFETEAAKYDGKYTVGVFEKVQAADHTFKAQHERETAARLAALKQQAPVKSTPKDPLFGGTADSGTELQNDNANTLNQTEDEQEQHEIQLIPFGYRSQRKEKRLNYVSTITLFLPGGQEVVAKTSDISPTGIKVSLLYQIDSLDKGSHIHIQFTALEEQFKRQLGKVEYQVIAQEKDHHDKYQLRLARCDTEEKETFNQFITEFIDAYRVRYKIELEDDLQALYAKAYERIYTLASPITINLLHLSPGHRQSLYVATRNNNHDPLKNALLSSLSSSMAQFIDEHRPLESLLLETFVVQDPQAPRVFCATRQRLIADNTFDQFLNVGSRAHLIARVLVTISPINSQDLQSSAQPLEPLLEQSPIKFQELNERWQKVTHIAFLTFVEHKQKDESSLTESSNALESLKQYELKDHKVRLWQLGYRNQRQTERYLYSTPAIVTLDKQTINGTMVDFSPDGMRIKLTDSALNPASLDIHQSVKVTLPEMQKLAKKTANLKDLSYRITQWHPHQSAISLKRDFSVKKHHGEMFFKLLIKNNASKLQQCIEDVELTLMAETLEKLLASYLPGIPLFLSRYPGARYAIAAAAATENANPLIWRFKAQHGFDFLPLNQEDVFAELIRPHLNRRSQLTEPLTTRFFAKFPNDGTNQEPIEIIGEMNMKDTRDIARFILMTRKQPNHRILKASFYPPPYIKLEEFSEDLRKIRKNSPSRARDFEQKIMHIVALVEIEDITDFYKI